MFVLTIDQRHSRTETDRVPVLLDILREVCATSPPLAGFERTVGDEIQGLFGDAAGAVAAVRAVVREGGWHLGIGIGPIEGVPATVREGRGSAFVSAREAVDAAKSSGDVAVRAGGDAAVSPLMVSTIEVMCRFLAATIAGRTEAQIQAVRALDSGLTGRQAARELGVSASAVSQRRTAAGYDLEMRGWEVLEELMSAVQGGSGATRLNGNGATPLSGTGATRLSGTDVALGADATPGGRAYAHGSDAVVRDGRAPARGRRGVNADGEER